jgi:dTDP-4-amino-4,6-dideoxygalactose transaminase
MWSFKDHGKSYEAVYEREHPPGFRWLHESFGTNWRMLEMQAVIGRIQLKRMKDWKAARTRNAGVLFDALRLFDRDGGPVRVARIACDSCPARTGAACSAGCEHAFYKFYCYARPEGLADGWTRDRIIEAINAEGVPCYQGSCSEVYLEKAFDNTGWRPEVRLPVAKALGETSIMFLVHPTLTEAEMRKAADAITLVFTRAQRTAA